MAQFEKMLTAFEPADGDCEALAKRILAFAETEDADAIRAMSRDKELDAFMKAHQTEIEREYATVKDRFMAIMNACGRDEDVSRALDKSKLFVKKRDDGTIVEENEEDED